MKQEKGARFTGNIYGDLLVQPPHITVDGTIAHRGQMICPMLVSWQAAKMG